MKENPKRKRDNDSMSVANHVAIIMDGNGRWALQKGKSRNYGHQCGLRAIEKLLIIQLKKNFLFNIIYVFKRKLEKTKKRS